MIRGAYPASQGMLAAAYAALNAQQIVAEFQASYLVDDVDMTALRAAQRPAHKWTEDRAIGRDLLLNAMKADGRYDQRRSGARA